MPVRIEPNAEPIPGYKLVERLGGGGFGEVWKAEAPGGLEKAIKFVYGDLHSSEDSDGARACQELKALSRVKSVHHPYLLSLERFDIIDGQLIIVMELAHRTLWDRFRECRSQGLPGIPREELLVYIRETAEALDLMNIQFQLQHLDIKPQNLFLVFNHIKVADFGLVKDLGDMAAATVTGGVTPVYAAPETFDGWLSRFSDQYSLAIVYHELLTGHRPFAGSTMRQLVLQHLQGDPDLSSLPVGDRAAVKRALAKNPDDRFATCVEFVQALGKAVAPGRPTVTHSHEPAAPLPPLPKVPADSGESVEADALQITRDLRRKREPEPVPPPAAPAVPPPPAPPPAPPPPRPEPVALQRPTGPAPKPKPALHDSRLGPVTEAHRRKPKPSTQPGFVPAADSGFRGIVQPSLVVGLGNLGVQTLIALRRTLTDEFGHPDALAHIRLVGIDTDPETIRKAGNGDPRSLLRQHELLLARLHRPSHYLQQRDRDGNLPTDSWLNSKLIYCLPKQTNTARLRALGRLAFVDNHRHIAKRLEAELEACISQETLPELVEPNDLGIRSGVPRVYVVAALAGSTGSGMFLDAAYTIRNLLRKQGYPRIEVVGLFYLPSLEREGISSSALAQTYAALRELHHYASGQTAFSALYSAAEPGAGFKSMAEAGSPFERCFFLTLPPPISRTTPGAEVPEAVTLAGQFLYRDIATPLGKAIDASRQQARVAAAAGSGASIYRTLGLYRIVWPRKTLCDRAARRLSRKLVERWMAKDASAVAASITAWTEQQWDACGLRSEALISRHQEACEKKLQQPPERLIQAVLATLSKSLGMSPGGKADSAAGLSLAPVVAAMASLEKLLGVPEECRAGNLAAPEPGAVESALAEAAEAIADDCDHKLSELIVHLLEDPHYRLAGAEEGLRRLGDIAEQALQSQETLTKELHDRAAALFQRVQALLESPHLKNLTQSTSGPWKLGLGRKAANAPTFAQDLLELIRLFAKTRYQALVLGHIQRLYVSLRGHLSDQIREIGFCRMRLRELASLVEDKAAATPVALASFDRLLLPHGCKDMDEAIKRLDESFTPEDLVQFDSILEPIIRQQYKALLNVCMGPSNLVRTLAPLMLQEAETFLAPRFQGGSVAEMWMLEKDSEEDAVAEELASAFDEAAPEEVKPRQRQELAVAVFPTTPAGQQLKKLALQALPPVQLVDEERGDEIVFYRELQNVILHELPQAGPIAQEAYRQCGASDPALLHIRSDIPAWQPVAS